MIAALVLALALAGPVSDMDTQDKHHVSILAPLVLNAGLALGDVLSTEAAKRNGAVERTDWLRSDLRARKALFALGMTGVDLGLQWALPRRIGRVPIRTPLVWAFRVGGLYRGIRVIQGNTENARRGK